MTKETTLERWDFHGTENYVWYIAGILKKKKRNKVLANVIWACSGWLEFSVTIQALKCFQFLVYWKPGCFSLFKETCTKKRILMFSAVPCSGIKMYTEAYADSCRWTFFFLILFLLIPSQVYFWLFFSKKALNLVIFL